MAPFLLTLLCGGADLSRGRVMARRPTVAATSTALIASTMAVQQTSLNALTGQQAWQATTAPFALFPQWLAEQQPDFSTTLSAVSFSGASTGYVAHVAWSVANPAGLARLRACGTLSAAPDDSASSLASLPADAFGATSILVADVSATFYPAFTTVFVAPFVLERSAYVSPRINNGTALRTAFPGPSVTCPVA